MCGPCNECKLVSVPARSCLKSRPHYHRHHHNQRHHHRHRHHHQHLGYHRQHLRYWNLFIDHHHDTDDCEDTDNMMMMITTVMTTTMTTMITTMMTMMMMIMLAMMLVMMELEQEVQLRSSLAAHGPSLARPCHINAVLRIIIKKSKTE